MPILIARGLILLGSIFGIGVVVNETGKAAEKVGKTATGLSVPLVVGVIALILIIFIMREPKRPATTRSRKK